LSTRSRQDQSRSVGTHRSSTRQSA
jgi:hypothetical protein